MGMPKFSPSVCRDQLLPDVLHFAWCQNGSIEPQSWQSLGNHGNWCGYNNTRSDPNYPVVDAVDGVCRTHDICVSGGHKCSCDSRFIDGMRRAVAAPGVGARGRAYATAAITAFQAKPCYCKVRVFGRRNQNAGNWRPVWRFSSCSSTEKSISTTTTHSKTQVAVLNNFGILRS